jgi:hypothetical protein
VKKKQYDRAEVTGHSNGNVVLAVCLRLGPHERTKCVRCIAYRDVLCRNRKEPIDLNIRGTRALLDGSHDVRWFSMDARTHVEPCWMTSELCVPSNGAGQTGARPGLHERTKCVRCNERHDTAVEIERNQ